MDERACAAQLTRDPVAIYLEGNNGIRRAIPMSVAQRCALIQAMVDFCVGTEGDVRVRVPVDAELLDPMIETLGSDHVPSDFDHSALLGMVTALDYLQANCTLGRICSTIGQSISVADDQCSSTAVKQQLEQYSETLGVPELPVWFIKTFVSQMALMNFQDKCQSGLSDSELICPLQSIWGCLHSEWFANLHVSSVQIVDLSRNSIESVLGQFTFERFSSLQELNLGGNQISAISRGAFDGLALLRVLNLSGNQLGAIADGTFAGMPSLHALLLGDNQISTIAENAFDGLPSLQQLDLSGNQLRSVVDVCFAPLVSLQYLYLNGNRISAIGKGAFATLSSLQSLILYDNVISTIADGAFDGLLSVHRLCLSGNQISAISKGTFATLLPLQALGLGGNRISAIGNGAFSDLSFLEWLDLTGNQITAVGEYSFQGLSSLQTLNLSCNRISSIANGAFLGLSSLQKLVLIGNSVGKGWGRDNHVATNLRHRVHVESN
ncbi:unnamed protein product (mitochondrion) [Plasmodiophora brassicae]|uniref:Uncharacterized protein n=1 Tax=Plasmodiophora brassicae TaxID=37360 RepID=A0A3P3Y0U9_PLABS|nr:unnamed protein product [Plasmodiophora brassicae]